MAMATTFKEGDRVRIVDRAMSDEDIKSQLFYDHYRGLTGKVQKVYQTDEIAVEIEHDALLETVAVRHMEVKEQMKTKWMNGLSEEAKGRLSDAEKDFQLRYTVLVMAKDLVAAKGIAAPSRATTDQLIANEQAYLEQKKKTDGGNA